MSFSTTQPAPAQARKGASADTGNAGHFAARQLTESGTEVDLHSEITQVITPGQAGTKVVSHTRIGPQGTPIPTNAADGGPGRREYDSAGRLTSRTFYDQDGRVHQGPNGEAACEEYYPDGTLSCRYLVVHGRYADGPNGEPGWSAYWPGGAMQAIGHYREGVLDDPNDHDPAAVAWHENGQMSDYSHYARGQLHSEGDRPTQRIFDEAGHTREINLFTRGLLTDRPGRPARMFFSEAGRSTRAEYWRDGERTNVRYPS